MDRCPTVLKYLRHNYDYKKSDRAVLVQRIADAEAELADLRGRLAVTDSEIDEYAAAIRELDGSGMAYLPPTPSVV